MILIKLAKNKNKTIKEAYGKYYARPVVTETIGIDELAEHMASHNTPFSKGAIKGLLRLPPQSTCYRQAQQHTALSRCQRQERHGSPQL